MFVLLINLSIVPKTGYRILCYYFISRPDFVPPLGIGYISGIYKTVREWDKVCTLFVYAFFLELLQHIHCLANR